MFCDATYVKARLDGRVVSRAVVATGVAANGHREVLGCDVGDSEDEVFWTQFLRSLRQRSLSGVRLVISDAHEGLKAAVGRVLAGAGWQRCRVHFVRSALAKVSKSHAEMVAATVRTIFAQPDALAAREQLHAVVDMLRGKFPAVADQLADAEADLLAYAAFRRATDCPHPPVVRDQVRRSRARGCARSSTASSHEAIQGRRALLSLCFAAFARIGTSSEPDTR